MKEIFKEGKNIYTLDQFGMDIDMNYDFGSNTHFFIYIIPSVVRLDGNGIMSFELVKESVIWDNILQSFCELYDIKYNQPRWYLTNEVWN